MSAPNIINPFTENIIEHETNSWKYSEDKYKKLADDNRFYWGKDGKQKYPRIKRFLSELSDGLVPVNLWKHIDTGTGDEGTKEVNSLVGKDVFIYPKPIRLLQRILGMGDKNDLILDFFAGSGTTAHAVMQLNAEDGGNRKFILCQLDEKIDPEKSKPAHDFCTENNFEPVISSITIERVNRAGDKIKAENPDKNIDIGYKVFSLTDKPQVNYDDKQKSFKVENKRINNIDTLINMLVATCKTLDIKVEAIKEKAIYKADNEIYIIDKVTSDELEQFKNLKINIDSMADIDLENYLNLDIANKDNITIIY